jgi:hypothetical protein
LQQEKGSPLPLYEIAAKRLHERVRAFDSQRDEARTLQPGNSIVQVFTLQTTRAILFLAHELQLAHTERIPHGPSSQPGFG